MARIKITSSVVEPAQKPDPVWTIRTLTATVPSLTVKIERYTPFPATEPDSFYLRVEDRHGRDIGDSYSLGPDGIVEAHRVIGAAIEAAREKGILPEA
jgi:hypothetical protein